MSQAAASFLKQLSKGPQKSTNSKVVRCEYSDSVYVWQWHYFQQQSEVVNGSCNEFCGHLKVQWPSLKHCDWGNALWTTWWISLCQYTTISVSCIHLTLGVSHHRTLCGLLTSLNIRRGDRNWPAALQHAMTVMFLLLSNDIKTLTLLDPFSVIMVSGLLVICMPISSKLKMFLSVSERLSSGATLSSV